MKCLTWNLEWASPISGRLKLMQKGISEVDPDVVCYTEVIRTVLPEGHAVEASADYGYPNTGDRRKVVLWSKNPWTDFDAVGDPEMPSGRFVSGVTGGIRFVGVCIPWRDAHVRGGRKDRKAWEDHLSYCDGLKRVLDRYSELSEPICILGDYNQRIPRVRQPKPVAKALMNAMPDDFTISTEGMKDGEGKALIDHFAVSSLLTARDIKILPRFAADGTRLSDHVGVAAHLGRNNANQAEQPTPKV